MKISKSHLQNIIKEELRAVLSEQGTKSYRILAGDNLWTLARDNNTTIDDIVRANPEYFRTGTRNRRSASDIGEGDIINIPAADAQLASTDVTQALRTATQDTEPLDEPEPIEDPVEDEPDEEPEEDPEEEVPAPVPTPVPAPDPGPAPPDERQDLGPAPAPDAEAVEVAPEPQPDPRNPKGFKRMSVEKMRGAMAYVASPMEVSMASPEVQSFKRKFSAAIAASIPEDVHVSLGGTNAVEAASHVRALGVDPLSLKGAELVNLFKGTVFASVPRDKIEAYVVNRVVEETVDAQREESGTADDIIRYFTDERWTDNISELTARFTPATREFKQQIAANSKRPAELVPGEGPRPEEP